MKTLSNFQFSTKSLEIFLNVYALNENIGVGWANRLVKCVRQARQVQSKTGQAWGD